MQQVAALENFRENLRKRCERQRISQRDLADKAGVHFTTVSRVLMGHIEPSVPLAEQLAEATGISLEKILRDPS
jgi:transcriptional regulator with XRE-family HTH domain